MTESLHMVFETLPRLNRKVYTKICGYFELVYFKEL